jgi:hypothetical protein
VGTVQHEGGTEGAANRQPLLEPKLLDAFVPEALQRGDADAGRMQNFADDAVRLPVACVQAGI